MLQIYFYLTFQCSRKKKRKRYSQQQLVFRSSRGKKTWTCSILSTILWNKPILLHHLLNSLRHGLNYWQNSITVFFIHTAQTFFYCSCHISLAGWDLALFSVISPKDFQLSCGLHGHATDVIKTNPSKHKMQFLRGDFTNQGEKKLSLEGFQIFVALVAFILS